MGVQVSLIWKSASIRLSGRYTTLAFLSTNCTTNDWWHTRINPGHLPYSWKLDLSGYVPEYLYEAGRIDASVPFAELQQRSRINALAREADQAEDFSQPIRRGLGSAAQ